MKRVVPCLGAALVIVVAWLASCWLVGVTLAAPPQPPFATTPLHFPPHDGSHPILPTAAVDGDTLHFYWLVPDTARLALCNAPELKAEGGFEAKQAFSGMLTMDKPMKAIVHGRDKYGRALLELFDDQGRSLSKLMIDSGHAKAWNGQGERP